MALGIMLFCVPFVVKGGEVYRCVENGRTIISTSPCVPGAKSEQIATDQISKDSVQDARDDVARMREKLDRLEQKYAVPRAQASVIARPSWEAWEEAPEPEGANYYYPVYESSHFLRPHLWHDRNWNASTQRRDANKEFPGHNARPGQASGQVGKWSPPRSGQFASGHVAPASAQSSASHGNGKGAAHSGPTGGGGGGRSGHRHNTTTVVP
jgi:hypothetical protein